MDDENNQGVHAGETGHEKTARRRVYINISHRNCFRPVKFCGIVPDSRLLHAVKVISAVRFEMEGGTVPERLLLQSSSELQRASTTLESDKRHRSCTRQSHTSTA